MVKTIILPRIARWQGRGCNSPYMPRLCMLYYSLFFYFSQFICASVSLSIWHSAYPYVCSCASSSIIMFPASLSVPLSVSASHCLSICIHLSPLCSLSLSLRLSHVACISCCVCHLTHALTARFTNDAAQYESWNNDNNSDRNNTRQLQPSYTCLL